MEIWNRVPQHDSISAAAENVNQYITEAKTGQALCQDEGNNMIALNYRINYIFESMFVINKSLMAIQYATAYRA